MAGGPDLIVELINCRPSSIVHKNCTHGGNPGRCKHHKIVSCRCRHNTYDSICHYGRDTGQCRSRRQLQQPCYPKLDCSRSVRSVQRLPITRHQRRPTMKRKVYSFVFLAVCYFLSHEDMKDFRSRGTIFSAKARFLHSSLFAFLFNRLSSSAFSCARSLAAGFTGGPIVKLGLCAIAASGHATAAPPRSVMNPRRRMCSVGTVPFAMLNYNRLRKARE